METAEAQKQKWAYVACCLKGNSEQADINGR